MTQIEKKKGFKNLLFLNDFFFALISHLIQIQVPSDDHTMLKNNRVINSLFHIKCPAINPTVSVLTSQYSLFVPYTKATYNTHFSQGKTLAQTSFLPQKNSVGVIYSLLS